MAKGDYPQKTVEQAEGDFYKFKSEYVELAKKFCLLAATDVQLARLFDVGVDTLIHWRNTVPEFAEACFEGKQVADANVASSLYNRAVGYTITRKRIFCSNGQIVEQEYEDYVLPDVQAQQYWLQNRQRENWQSAAALRLMGPSGEALEGLTVNFVMPGEAEPRSAANGHDEGERLNGSGS